MALACQINSYLTELETRVQSCEAGTLQTVVGGKKQKLAGYEIILDDTVLFPEGGGQPDDRGTICDIEVMRVVRRGAEAVHFTPAPIDPGQQVKVKVNWDRRWDNMQQHSGQHLVTAIADAQFGYPTTSWNLGDTLSTIEIDTPTISEEQLVTLERLVNQKIREGVKMYPTLYESKEEAEQKEVRTRGLPDDHEGAVRIVTIDGIEDNMCCGTHVSNLAHLQAIKILGTEKGKKGRINLIFVAGNRVTEYLGRAYDRERSLTALINGPPEKHTELVEKTQKSLKVALKAQTMLLRAMAKLEAAMFKTNPQKVFVLHRKEGDHEFMNNIINEINDKSVFILVTVGDEKGVGMFMLSGPEDDVTILGPQVLSIIEGKGSGKRGVYQGKANKLSKRHLAEKLLREYSVQQSAGDS